MALVQQMGQAAQAHAAEAARLQAMAQQMQSGLAIPPTALVNNTNMIPYLGVNNMNLLTPGGGPHDGSTFVIQNPLDQMPQMNSGPEPPNPSFPGAGDPWPGSGEDQVVTQSFPEVMPDSPAPRSMGLAATMSRVLGNEPVQIRTETLRSLSNNSLCRMAEEEEAQEEQMRLQQMAQAGIPLEQADAWDKAQTFAEGEEYDNDFDTEFHQGFQAAQGGNGLGNVSEKRSQDTPLEGQQAGLSSMPGAQSSQMPPGAVRADALGAGITVRNTFLEFDGPKTEGLRSVRTAGGRLDMMAQHPHITPFSDAP